MFIHFFSPGLATYFRMSDKLCLQLLPAKKKHVYTVTVVIISFLFILGLCLLLFDFTWSATLAVTEAPTAVYGDLTSCISFGELDIVVDVNLTDPDTNQVLAFGFITNACPCNTHILLNNI